MTRRISTIIGNFDMGECFAEVTCIHGHPTRLFNIGRDHYVACDTCKTVIAVGRNLTSSWKWENEAIWQRNSDKVQDYMLLER
jgi:hypothetical protein